MTSSHIHSLVLSTNSAHHPYITCNDLICTPGVNLNNKQERIIDNNAYLCYNLPLVEVLGLLERVG